MRVVTRVHVHVGGNYGEGLVEAKKLNPSTDANHWKIVENVNKEGQDFNAGTPGHHVYVYYYLADLDKETAEVPIIQLMFKTVPNGGPPTPAPGWVHAGHSGVTGKPGNFNSGDDARSPDIYLYYRPTIKDAHGAWGGEPIVELKAGTATITKDFKQDVGRAMLDFEPGYIVLRQDTNERAGGIYVFLGYKYGASK